MKGEKEETEKKKVKLKVGFFRQVMFLAIQYNTITNNRKEYVGNEREQEGR